MLENLINNIRLSLWRSKKRIGPNKEILLHRTYDCFSDTVYDLTWSLKLMNKAGKVVAKKVIQERASKWNLKEVIARTENDRLPKTIKNLLESAKS